MLSGNAVILSLFADLSEVVEVLLEGVGEIVGEVAVTEVLFNITWGEVTD